jgi:hypothetical protein
MGHHSKSLSKIFTWFELLNLNFSLHNVKLKYRCGYQWFNTKRTR